MQYYGNNRNDSIAIIAVYYFQYRPTLVVGEQVGAQHYKVTS